MHPELDYERFPFHFHFIFIFIVGIYNSGFKGSIAYVAIPTGYSLTGGDFLFWFPPPLRGRLGLGSLRKEKLSFQKAGEVLIT